MITVVPALLVMLVMLVLKLKTHGKEPTHRIKVVFVDLPAVAA